MEKMKLIESFVIKPDEYKERKDLKEQVLLIKENGEQKKYKAEAIYTFPISRPGEKNLNERIYPVSLWEKVIKEKQALNSYGLMDHPKEEGSTKDAFCVWRNIRFSEDKKLVLADSYLFGKWGRQVKEALEAGGEVGLSTSGYGEFEKDDITIDSDSYELERVADHVLNPSYAVFGKKEDEVEESTEKDKTSPIKEESVKTTVEEKKITPIEEKNFRLNVKAQIKEISSFENLYEKRKELDDLLSYFQDGVAGDLFEEVLNLIEENEKEIRALVEKGASFDKEFENAEIKKNEEISAIQEEKKLLETEITEMKSQIEELSQSLLNAENLLDSVKLYSNKLKEMYDVSVAEKNGMISASEYKEALVYIESLENDITNLKEQLSESENKSVSSEKEKTEFVEKDESILKSRPEIADYYKDLVRANPPVAKIKEDILACNTLMEAQRTYLRLKSLLDNYEIPERRFAIRGYEKETDPQFEEIEENTVKKALKIREGWL